MFIAYSDYGTTGMRIRCISEQHFHCSDSGMSRNTSSRGKNARKPFFSSGATHKGT